MSALFSQILPALGVLGGSGGETPPSSQAENRSINVNGASGGAVTDLLRILQYTQGPETNGGFTGDSVYDAISRQSVTEKYLPFLLIGGLALVAIVFLKKG